MHFPSPPKPPAKTRWLIWGVCATLALSLVVMCFAGCSRTLQALDRDARDVSSLRVPLREPLLNVGDSFNRETPEYTCSVVVVEAAVLTAAGDRAYMAVTAEITGVVGQTPYNPLYWTYRDRTGIEHSPELLFDRADLLKSGTLPAGQKVRGSVVFRNGGQPLSGGTIRLSSELFRHVATWQIP